MPMVGQRKDVKYQVKVLRLLPNKKKAESSGSAFFLTILILILDIFTPFDI